VKKLEEKRKSIFTRDRLASVHLTTFSLSLDTSPQAIPLPVLIYISTTTPRTFVRNVQIGTNYPEWPEGYSSQC
jgi:hypothetical protein